MFSEDLRELFDQEEGTAVAGTYLATPISVLFEELGLRGDGEDVDIETTQPAAVVMAADVPGVKIGSLISVKNPKSATQISYRVTGIKPDGTGQTTTLYLQEV